ncbi:S24 family peptidase [Photobacterium lutimaris]|nr:S24 family peptidase [Photobacterium lutimaris]
MISGIMTGFGNVAADYKENGLSLDQLLIDHVSSTFIARAKGNNMRRAGIHANDILLIDRSLTAEHGDIVLVVMAGEFYCRQYDEINRVIYDDKTRIPLTSEESILFEAVVTRSIRCHRSIPSLPSIG